MTPDQVAQLRAGDTIHMPRYQMSGIRGRVSDVLTTRIQVTWVDSVHSYDALCRTSPLWVVIELEPKK